MQVSIRDLKLVGRDNPDVSSYVGYSWYLNFTSDGETFTQITILDEAPYGLEIWYVGTQSVLVYGNGEWLDERYREINVPVALWVQSELDKWSRLFKSKSQIDNKDYKLYVGNTKVKYGVTGGLLCYIA